MASAKQRLAARDKAAVERGKKAGSKGSSGPPQLMPENLAAWEVFTAQMTQVICAPMGGVIGISHEGLEFKFRVFDVPRGLWRDTFQKFQHLEMAYVAAQQSKGKGGTGGAKGSVDSPSGKGRRLGRDS